MSHDHDLNIDEQASPSLDTHCSECGLVFAVCECSCDECECESCQRIWEEEEPADINDDFGYDPYAGGPEMDDPIDEYDRECDNDW